MARHFEHPGNGHREKVGVVDVVGALLLGPLYYFARGAWGYGVVLLLLALASAYMGILGLYWFVFWWGLFAAAAIPTIAQSYLRRGWREVEPGRPATTAGAPADAAASLAHPGDFFKSGR